MSNPTPAPAEALSQLVEALSRELGGTLYQHRKGGVYLEYSRREGMGQEAGERVFSGVMGAPLAVVTDDVIGMEEIVLYRDVVTGERYARPARLFDDGRFTPLVLTPTHTLARAEAAEAEVKRLREKAALWDGLLGMARVRALGWAGMNEDGTPAERDPRGDPYNGYAHLGLELWTKFPDNLHEFPTELARHERGKMLLTGIARISAALAGSPS